MNSALYISLNLHPTLTKNMNTEKSSSFLSQVIDPLLVNMNRFPMKNAFCINDIFYTYNQLGEYISKIRFAIKGLQQDNIHIGLVANDDIETYASIFALWLGKGLHSVTS